MPRVCLPVAFFWFWFRNLFPFIPFSLPLLFIECVAVIGFKVYSFCFTLFTIVCTTHFQFSFTWYEVLKSGVSCRETLMATLTRHDFFRSRSRFLTWLRFVSIQPSPQFSGAVPTFFFCFPVWSSNNVSDDLIEKKKKNWKQ